jgi:hypothetical protein
MMPLHKYHYERRNKYAQSNNSARHVGNNNFTGTDKCPIGSIEKEGTVMAGIVAFLIFLAIVSTVCTKGTDSKRRGKWW